MFKVKLAGLCIGIIFNGLFILTLFWQASTEKEPEIKTAKEISITIVTEAPKPKTKKTQTPKTPVQPPKKTPVAQKQKPVQKKKAAPKKATQKQPSLFDEISQITRRDYKPENAQKFAEIQWKEIRDGISGNLMLCWQKAMVEKGKGRDETLSVTIFYGKDGVMSGYDLKGNYDIKNKNTLKYALKLCSQLRPIPALDKYNEWKAMEYAFSTTVK